MQEVGHNDGSQTGPGDPRQANQGSEYDAWLQFVSSKKGELGIKWTFRVSLSILKVGCKVGPYCSSYK